MAITFIGAGTGVNGNNQSLSPGLPGFVADDLLLCFASARGNGTLGLSGWSEAWQVAHSSSGVNKVALFYKVAVGGEGTPSVTYSGGAAGHTVVAQTCVFRGVNPVLPLDVTGATASNASAANIGAITGITTGLTGTLVVVFGHRADDWTSVATLSGDGLTWNEIGEPDGTGGNDAGIVWDYAIAAAGLAVISAKTFTVTGGAANTGLGKMQSFNEFVSLLSPTGGSCSLTGAGY